MAPSTLATFEAISNQIGGAAAANLCAFFGHRSVLYVPVQATDGHILQTVLGRRAFSELVQAFGGQNLPVQNILAELRATQRAGLVHDMRSRGTSWATIAAALGVSIRTVHRLYAEVTGHAGIESEVAA
jgi:hypothetical protein